MGMFCRGSHRIKNDQAKEDSVWVIQDVIGFEMPRSSYVEGGYLPAIDTLPWRGPIMHIDDFALGKG